MKTEDIFLKAPIRPLPLPQMTRDEAIDFFSAFYRGRHHIPESGVKECGFGWRVSHYGTLSTFDFDALTRLVFMAHDRCVRVEIGQSGPWRLKIMIHKRRRVGDMQERHPTIDDALIRWRGKGENS